MSRAACCYKCGAGTTDVAERLTWWSGFWWGFTVGSGAVVAAVAIVGLA